MIWLGPWRTKSNSVLELDILRGSFNMLGSYIWREHTHKVYSFYIWNGRNLTLLGRPLFVKTFGISKYVYSLTRGIPDPRFQELPKKTFLWNKNQAKIKHSTLQGNLEWGGIKSTDIKTVLQSLGVAWVARLWKSQDRGDMINLYLEKYGCMKLLLR